MNRKLILSFITLLTLTGFFKAFAQPAIVTPGPISLCEGDTLNLEQSGGAYASYEWLLNGTSVVSTDSNLSMTVGLSDAGSYTVVGIVSPGVGDTSAAVTVTIDPTPVADFTISSACFGDSILFIDATTLASGTIDQWDWEFGDGDTDSGDTVSHTYGGLGPYTAVLTVKSDSSCVDTDTMEVSVNVPPSPQIEVDGSTVPGFDAVICSNGGWLSTSETFVSYTWIGGSTSPSIWVDSIGGYTVAVVDTNGCSGTDSISIVSTLPSPDVSIDGPDTLGFCPGGSVELDGWTAGVLAYLWNTAATSSTIIVSTPGDYYVIGTASNNCTDTSEVVSVIEYMLPNPDLGPDTAYCEGDSVVLDPGSGFSSYSWNTGFTTDTLLIYTPGTFIVEVTNSNGCAGQDTIFVTEYAMPTPFIGNDFSICEGESDTIGTLAPWPMTLWSTGDTTQNIVVNDSGSYFAIVTSSDGCTGMSNSLNVTLFANPAVPTISLANGTISTTDVAAAYQWYLDGALISGATGSSITPTEEGNYTLVVTNANGCTAESAQLFFTPTFTAENIPEGFSPNGDGTNDLFRIESIEFYPNNEIKIFNRWGNVVFEAAPYNSEWNGQSKQGNDLTDGTYFYILDLKDGSEPYSGYIIINR